ncbi:MAG TPA: cation:proton antiporter [Flavobacteriales bacterium]|nr:cation:proton antiporter [Flavobacteriales bacterium]
MEDGLYQELVVVLALAVGIILLFRRFKMPGVLGFILAGMIAGPHMLGWVDEVERVNALAEFGMVFLLFVIGMGFSLRELSTIGVTVFVGGTLQALFTIGLTAGVCSLFGMALPEAVFIGFLVTLSSTAIVLRVLQSKGQLDSPMGKVTAAILIFQDILVVPMMLVMPMMAGKSGAIGHDLLVLSGKVLLLLSLVYAGGRWGVPRLLLLVSKGRNQELFIITVVLLCFAAAWGTAALGLSLALGAFFAGLIISGTGQVHSASGIVQPFHQLFMSFFFVSIGMLLDPALFTSAPFTIIGLALLVMVGKTIAGFLAVWLLRYPVRTALQCGLALFQVGEFSFVLALAGIGYGLLSPAHHQLFLAVSIITMAATPVVMARSRRIAGGTFNKLLPRTGEALDALLNVGDGVAAPERTPAKDHLVLIGFGLAGQSVAWAAQSAKVRCMVIEEDPDLAEQAMRLGMYTVQGSAAQEAVLAQVDVASARAVVVSLPDMVEARRVVATVKALTKAPVLARSKALADESTLKAQGARHVVADELEGGLRLTRHVLHACHVDRTEIDQMVHHLRRYHQQAAPAEKD